MEMQQESRRSYEITISDTFPDIPSSPCSHIIDQIRSTIIDFLLQRLPDEIIKLRNQFPSECDSTEIEVVLYSLPPDTEFDLPNLLNIARSAVVPTKESSPSESTASEWLGLDESNADNAPTALSALKTEYGDCIPDKLKTTGVTQYLMKRPARNPLRPNTQFSHVRSPYSIIRLHSLHAGLLQASGLRQAHSRRCVDCVEGKGFWDSCVVATPDMPYDFMKACANCCYSGKPGRCSFSPGKYLTISLV
ncbi:hypothetical protein F5Y04DRAFT_8080 [Hypomontagnella monticulosa]|nr:hypothetical protein F5Y04DRAFT_8080 [Hypomontagnella monticulosa]